MTLKTDMIRYYADRAGEYERIYAIPERQGDLARLRARLVGLLAGHHVLEVACGTGYWTEALAPSAASIVATDINAPVLAIARNKTFPPGRVHFVQDDAFSLTGVTGVFTAGFAGFWLSHIERSRASGFLDLWHSRLGSRALEVIADNSYVEGESHPIIRRDAEGNTYQERCLLNGERFEVLKNFAEEAELRALLGDRAVEWQFEGTKYYWCLSYRLVQSRGARPHV